jgi:hypothetical protein
MVYTKMRSLRSAKLAILVLLTPVAPDCLHAAERPTASSVGTPCSIGALQRLLSLPANAFVVNRFPLTDQSAEGGTLQLLRRNGAVQRLRVELFGEAGKMVVRGARVGGDTLLIVQQVEYKQPLPKMPVRVKATRTETAYFCSNVFFIDREQRGATDADGGELVRLADWLTAQLKLRDVSWEIRLPRRN